RCSTSSTRSRTATTFRTCSRTSTLPTRCSRPRPPSVLILGVDPGLTRCGLGLVEADGPGRARLVSVSVARSPADADPAARLAAVGQAVELLLDGKSPDAVALERVFAQHNVRS